MPESKKEKNNKINKKSEKKSEYSESDNNFTESDPSEAVVSSNENESKKTDNDEIKKRAKESFIQTDFFEKVVKYIKTDNLIRKETAEFREKINTLKEEKNDLESFILKYLDFQEENVINIQGSGKLTKYESIRKKGINKDIIQQAIYDQIKKEKLIDDDEKLKELVEATYNVMEGKREKTTKTVLKRTFIKEKKEKIEKQKGEKEYTEHDEKPKKVKKSKKEK